MSLQLMVVLMFGTACILLLCTKLIAASVHKSLVHDIDAKPSPYGISRERGNNKQWGYCITKNGEVLYSDGSATVFTHISYAIREINILEKIEGYKLTKL